MKIIKFFLLQINGLFPFLYPFIYIFKNFNFFKGVKYYYQDYKKYLSKNSKEFPLKWINNYPIYYDRFEKAGVIPKHYFYQDIWAAKKIFKSKVRQHYDIGSRLNGFIAHCSIFTKVIMLDIRPLPYKIDNVEFIQTNCINMRNVKTASIASISSLHAVEHFGLGRYGDPVDPNAYKKAIKEIQRVCKNKGQIYFSVPIGRQRLEFNAHRVFDPRFIIKLFNKCKLVEFNAVDDNNKLIKNIKPDDFINANYSCGLFHFEKKAIKIK